jgi:hypothetical protein
MTASRRANVAGMTYELRSGFGILLRVASGGECRVLARLLIKDGELS